MNIEITETHITDVARWTEAELTVKLGPDGATHWCLHHEWEETWQPIPRYLYDAIMRHHREGQEPATFADVVASVEAAGERMATLADEVERAAAEFEKEVGS